MTRKEKELKVLEMFGLKVGDRVSFMNHEVVNVQGVYEIREKDTQMCLKRLPNGFSLAINCLIEYDWQKIEPSLKDKKCKDFKHCEDCPLSNIEGIECGYIKNMEEKTMEEIYNDIKQSVDKTKKVIYGEKDDRIRSVRKV